MLGARVVLVLVLGAIVVVVVVVRRVFCFLALAVVGIWVEVVKTSLSSGMSVASKILLGFSLTSSFWLGLNLIFGFGFHPSGVRDSGALRSFGARVAGGLRPSL